MKISNIQIIQILIITYIIITLFVSKYYDGGFSQTLTGNIIMTVLIVFMIVSLKQHKMLLIAFLLILFLSTKDYIRENFNDYLKSEIKGLQEENKYLNREISSVKKDNDKLKEDVQEKKQEVSAKTSELKSQEMQHAQDNANTEAIQEQQTNEDCERALKIWEERHKYPSDVQREYKEKLKKCANAGATIPPTEGYKNLVKFKCKNNIPYLNMKKIDNYSNLKHMVENFEFINKSCNPCITGCKYKYNDKIGIESSLIPVNTRYFN